MVVEYFVQCRGCTVEFSTPDGLGREKDSDGLRRRFQFSSRISRAVTLRAIPREDDYIVTASITVDGRELARASRKGEGTVPGEAVVLTAGF